MPSIKDDIQKELEERALLKDSNIDNDRLMKYARVFKKRLEPTNSDLQSSASYQESLDEFVDSLGYDTDSVFASKLASTIEEIYPELSTTSKEHKLPSSTKDDKDYPNETSDGDYEVKKNKENAERGKNEIEKEKKNMPGSKTSARENLIARLEKIRGGYVQAFQGLASDLAEAKQVLDGGFETRAHAKLKKALQDLSPVIKRARVQYRKTSSYLKGLKLNKYAAEDTPPKKEKEDDKDVKPDVQTATNILLELADKSEEVEDALLEVKNIVEDILPEEVDKDLDKLLDGDDDEKSDDKKDDKESDADDEEFFNDFTEDEEDVKPSDTFDDEAPIEDDAPVKGNPFAKGKGKEDDLDKLTMAVGKTNRLMKALRSLFGGMKQGSSEYMPEGQGAYNKEVKDLPNETTDGDYEVSKNKQRADRGKRLIDRENAGDFTTSPGKIQDVRNINAHFVPGRTAAQSAWIVTANGEPTLVVTYNDAAGQAASEIKNWNTFTSKAYQDELIKRVKEAGLQATATESRGKMIRHKTAQASWKDIIVKKAVKDPGKIKSYYTDAYGDAGYAADMVKDYGKKTKASTDPKIAALETENAKLRRKEVLRVRAQKAIDLAKKISSMSQVPLTTTEFKQQASSFMKLDDESFQVLVNTIKRAGMSDGTPAIEAPQEAGIVHNTFMGVEGPFDGGSLELVDGTDGLPSDVEKSAKNPEDNVKPSDVKAYFDRKKRRPSASGVIPQIKTASATSEESGIDSLSQIFTCTANKLRAQGLSDDKIAEFNRKVKRF